MLTTTGQSSPRLLGRYSWLRVFTAITFALGGLFTFLAMLDAVKEQADLARIDTPLAQWLTSTRTPVLTLIMQLITYTVAPIPLLIVVLVGCFIWARRTKTAWQPLLLSGAMVTAFVISSVVKLLVERSRPPIVHMVPPFELDYSFPSGHTIGAAVCLLVIGYFVLSKKRSMHSLIVWAILSGFSIVTVAFSRLYLGYHWITDVTASIGLAFIILAVVIAIDPLQPKRFRKPSLEEGL